MTLKEYLQTNDVKTVNINYTTNGKIRIYRSQETALIKNDVFTKAIVERIENPDQKIPTIYLSYTPKEVYISDPYSGNSCLD